MEWFAIALGATQFLGGLFGSNKQREIDKAKTELTYKSNLEDIRRREFEQETVKGVAKAFSEDAGVLHTKNSTPQTYLDTMAREFEKELTFMRQYAEEARRLGMEQARVNRQVGLFSAITGGARTAGSLWS